MNWLGLHKALERNSGLLIFGILVVVVDRRSRSSAAERCWTIRCSAPTQNVVPHAALELVGRDVYIRESCSTCHSQQVRPLLGRGEALRTVRARR